MAAPTARVNCIFIESGNFWVAFLRIFMINLWTVGYSVRMARERLMLRFCHQSESGST
jgi:hypothetical protein